MTDVSRAACHVEYVLCVTLANVMLCVCYMTVRWGMTELSPIGTMGTATSEQIGDGLSKQELITAKAGPWHLHR